MDDVRRRALEDARSQVAAAPESVHAQADLVLALAAERADDELFDHLRAAYDLGLANSLAGSRVRRLLNELADAYAARAGLNPNPWPTSPPSLTPSPAPPPPAPPGLEPEHIPTVPPPDARQPIPVSSSGEFEEPGGTEVEFARPRVTLDDVAGLGDVKAHLERKVLVPLRNPEVVARFGRGLTGGLLMWGPPGCGKTFIARALAGSLDAAFCAVGMDEVLDMWIGSSERNLASVFAEARGSAPAVLFFDEFDAIGGRRSRMGLHATMRSVVSVLLTELDGAVRDNSGVFTIAASNLPWDVDPALRRPGRLDRTVFVPPPDHIARVGILANRLSETQIGLDLDLGRIASLTVGCSGADVSAVVDDAIDTAIAATLHEGHEVPVGQAELEEAAARTHPSIEDWVTMATVAAESSDDEQLYGPFLDWLRDRRRR